MRAAWVMALILAGSGIQSAAVHAALPSGTYTGTAVWRGPDGSSGTYTVEKTFAENTISARYSWVDGQAREEKITVAFAIKAAEPTFDVLDGRGQVVGRGYCYDDACSYRAAFGPVNVDESFSWSKSGITVLGAKSGPGFSVVWKETLEPR